MSEFEKYRATLTTVNLLMSANCCRHAFDYQQSEIDQLKVQLSLQRDRNKALEAELTSSRNYGDQLKAEKAGLEKRVEDALSLAEKWAAIEFEKTTHWSEGYEEGCLHCSLQLKETLRGGHE